MVKKNKIFPDNLSAKVFFWQLPTLFFH